MMLRAPMLLLALAASTASVAECYTVDSAKGGVSYEVQQAGSPFRGTFRRFGGEICVDGGQVASIEVWLEPSSVDSGLPEIDAALREKDFFDVKKFPRALFTSRSIRARADEEVAHGTLEMKGKRRDFDVSFKLQRDAGGAKVSGSLKLNRLDYGIGTGEWANTEWLSGEVKVDFRAALRRK